MLCYNRPSTWTKKSLKAKCKKNSPMPAGIHSICWQWAYTFRGSATTNSATLQRFRLVCSRCKSRFRLPTSALPMLSHPALCSPDSGFFQTTRMFPCIIVCALDNAIKIAKPRKSGKSFAGSLYLVPKPWYSNLIASLPVDCDCKISNIPWHIQHFCLVILDFNLYFICYLRLFIYFKNAISQQLELSSKQ